MCPAARQTKHQTHTSNNKTTTNHNHPTGQPEPENRDVATAAACVIAAGQGADIVRVHNVGLVQEALSVADVVLRRNWAGLDGDDAAAAAAAPKS
jgi:dihydropteroate synthase